MAELGITRGGANILFDHFLPKTEETLTQGAGDPCPPPDPPLEEILFLFKKKTPYVGDPLPRLCASQAQYCKKLTQGVNDLVTLSTFFSKHSVLFHAKSDVLTHIYQ